MACRWRSCPAASATITLTVYQHVHPGMGRQAADRFAALLEG